MIKKNDMKNSKFLFYGCLMLFTVTSLLAKDYKIKSPDGRNKAVVQIDKEINLLVTLGSSELFSINNLYMKLEDGRILGASKVIGSDQKYFMDLIHPTLKEKVAEIKDEYNELRINFKPSYTLVIRAYNTGIAYRFETGFELDIVVSTENLEVNFNDENDYYFQSSESFNSSYETPYQFKKMDEISTTDLIGLPLLAMTKQGARILITESDLEDYPGLWLKNNRKSFVSTHPGYPKELISTNDAYRVGQIKEHENFIAKTNGKRSFPWRLFIIAANDQELLTNTMVYQLAQPLEIEDPSWIESGIVTFDWWARRSIYGVDFKAGVNTETAKYFIDFADEYGFKYFLFDDGWTDQGDVSKINPELDMEEVVKYAKNKNIKIMLWAIWSAFEKDWQGNFDRFEEWGISGIKFDFMNRDDQKMVQFYHKVAKEAAKRKMVINFHGAYKPTGLRRAYPNIITREALIEFEYNGWTSGANPEHHNLLPYLRMVTGPMDYIPFTTNNSQKKDFRNNGDRPMGLGTRAHSMALSIILESPMQMLPDSPSDYYREKECTTFFSQLKVEWDEIKVLEAKVGDYTIIARRNGKDWYIGGITDWESRDFKISFNFLGEGNYTMEYIEDGINADVTAKDYKLNKMEVNKASNIEIHMAKGGGWLAKLIKN